MKHLVRLNGFSNYGRHKNLLMTNGVCNNCNSKDVVMCLDSSDLEYGYVCICEKCVLHYFNAFTNNLLEDTDICRGCDTVCKMSDLIEHKGKFSSYFRCKECIKYAGI